jgi:hypothetical protein
MDLIGALSRLGFNDQAKPTAEEVREAWEKQAKSIASRYEATSDGLSRARDRLLKYAEETAAKENAMRVEGKAADIDRDMSDRLSGEIERLRVELPAAQLLAASKKASRPRAGKVHGRTLDNKEKVWLLLEMERVFAERFEENQDGKVLAKDLLRVFEKFTTNPGFNYNDFTYHSRKIFLKIWPQAACKTFRHDRCFTGVKAKFVSHDGRK